MITVNQTGNVETIKNPGLISTEDLDGENSSGSVASVGIGHVRYPTTGSKGMESAQPYSKRVGPSLLSRRSGYIAREFIMAHNGQVKIKDDMRPHLKDLEVGSRSDSDILLNILTQELSYHTALNEETIRKTLFRVDEYLDGSYSVVLYVTDVGLIAFRDKRGIKPLSIGKYDLSESNNYIVNSESVALSGVNYDHVCDVLPGEAIVFYNNKERKEIVKIQYCEANLTPCIFEWIYIANVSSVIEGVSVYNARQRMGEYLAVKIMAYLKANLMGSLNIDYVVPVPETSKPAAIIVAEIMDIKYRELLIKNRYVNRTFIMDSQKKRKNNIRHKFLVIDNMVRGKNIILVDDSIVRGNTLKHLVGELKRKGARAVIVASCSPAIKYVNRYGIDIQDPELLIARGKGDVEIAKELGADAVIYQDIDDLKKSVTDYNPEIKDFEMSVFEGDK
jgi:amidophosphoribosyltransferase